MRHVSRHHKLQHCFIIDRVVKLRLDRMHVLAKSPSPHTSSGCADGRPCALTAARQPAWHQATATRRLQRKVVVRGRSEQVSQAGSTAADGAAAEELRQASASGSSVSSTLDSLDALLSSTSTDAEDDFQPGAILTTLMQVLGHITLACALGEGYGCGTATRAVGSHARLWHSMIYTRDL